MSESIDPYVTSLQFMYNAVGHSNYQEIIDVIESFPISSELKEDLKARFPKPGCVAPASWNNYTDNEDFTEAFATDPRNPGPLSEFQEHGWMDDANPDSYREDLFYKDVQSETGIKDLQVLDDIRENTIHILGRCNNPADWGEENKQGLVYGMVQSGKTASMINLIAMGVKAGYKFFIILAGDKNSLRKQTQKRVNQAFRLQNGINTLTGIHSPTYKSDFGDTGDSYTGTFRTQNMLREGRQYVTILVIKKETNHLNHLIQQINNLNDFCERTDGQYNLIENFPTLILDDEADYASLDTNPLGNNPSSINADLINLRQSIPRNCYAAYTATPQACLSSDPNSLIGYPKDFIWLLEPFVEERNGQEITRSYLGAWDIFWEYDEYLINEVGRNEWPHYEKGIHGNDLGIWYPGLSGNEGEHVDDKSNDDYQKLFLEQVRDGIRPIPSSLIDALIDFVIGAGIRWWSHWKKGNSGTFPTEREISGSYPHHAIMIHLSRLVQHQLISRKIVELAWVKMKLHWESFDIDNSDQEHPFMKQWSYQGYRTSRLKPGRAYLSYPEISHFIKIAIKISEAPISKDIPPYEKHSNSAYTYLVNSGDNGMRLYYDDDDPWQIKTKRAAIIIGGQILSRGLTIEGLSVSFFGRTAKMPMGDSVLQMGRWFGHKKSYIDLISIYMQDGLRVLFREIANADRHLRVQIKDAIYDGRKPDKILIELRNSPHFRATSPDKSRFVNYKNSRGFSGRKATLKEPTFSKDAILHNNKYLRNFELQFRTKSEEVHNRANLYSNIPASVVISLLEKLKCKDTATQDSYSDYARYLKDWISDETLNPIPRINIAIMKNRLRKRTRALSISKPISSQHAREKILGRYSTILGGSSPHSSYLGDAFLDKSISWHQENPNSKPSDIREYGKDDILIIFYGLQPNYVRDTLFDKNYIDDKNPLGKFRKLEDSIKLQKGDRFHIDFPEKEEEKYSILVFVAFTPRGGPQYGIGTNSFITPAPKEEELLEDD
jgi:hypothetical protein